VKAPNGGFWDHWLARCDRALSGLELISLVLLLGALIGLSGAQVVLRNFFDTGISWADPAARALVLWLALVGGFSASRRHKHIRIDLLNHYLGSGAKRLVNAAVYAISAAICGLVSWHGWRLLRTEIEFGEMAFANVPVWWVQSIIPIGFGAIAIVFLWHAVSIAVHGMDSDP